MYFVLVLQKKGGLYTVSGEICFKIVVKYKV